MHGRFVAGIPLGMLMTLLVIGGLNYLVDPLQYYRKAEFYKPLFSGQQRFRNPGIARHYSYDAVVLGTSTADYLLPRTIRDTHGWTAVSLRLNGATAYEQRRMFDVVARHSDAPYIIWGLDYDAYLGSPERKHDSSLFPEYLYGHTLRGALAYLVNVRVLYWSLENLLRTPRFNSLEEMQNDYKSYRFSREVFRAHLAGMEAAPQTCDVPTPAVSPGNANLDALIALIRGHPGRTFYLFLPPYSALYYARLCERGVFQDFSAFRGAVMSELVTLDNVRLYDFQPIPSITHDLDNYKDDLHYSPLVARYVLQSMKNGHHRVRVGDGPARVELLSAQTKAFLTHLRAHRIADRDDVADRRGG